MVCVAFWLWHCFWYHCCPYKTDVASLALISSCLFWAQSRTDWRVRAQNSGVMPPTDRRVVRAGGTCSCEPISIWPTTTTNATKAKQANTDTATGQETIFAPSSPPATLKAVWEYQPSDFLFLITCIYISCSKHFRCHRHHMQGLWVWSEEKHEFERSGGA